MPLIKAGSLPTGNVEGGEFGATTSLIIDHSGPGRGPRLHKHPYDETRIFIEGDLTFQAGEERFNATPGDIVIVPPETPHKFTSNGPGACHLVCIHANPTFVTDWLE